MNRTLNATAALLGLKPRTFRKRLREIGILTQSGELASKHRDRGYLYVDARSRWNPSINTFSHYSVVIVKEKGVAWLAKQLGIEVTQQSKDKVA